MNSIQLSRNQREVLFNILDTTTPRTITQATRVQEARLKINQQALKDNKYTVQLTDAQRRELASILEYSIARVEEFTQEQTLLLQIVKQLRDN